MASDFVRVWADTPILPLDECPPESIAAWDIPVEAYRLIVARTEKSTANHCAEICKQAAEKYQREGYSAAEAAYRIARAYK